jgi:hypothetical protein
MAAKAHSTDKQCATHHGVLDVGKVDLGLHQQCGPYFGDAERVVVQPLKETAPLGCAWRTSPVRAMGTNTSVAQRPHSVHSDLKVRARCGWQYIPDTSTAWSPNRGSMAS